MTRRIDRLMHAGALGAEIDPDAAALVGDLDCLVYAHQHGAAWGPNTMACAAVGSIECMVYCHEHGATWSEATTALAARLGHADCLEYAVENGAPLAGDAVLEVISGHRVCLGPRRGWTRGDGHDGRCGHILCLEYLVRRSDRTWPERSCTVRF